MSRTDSAGASCLGYRIGALNKWSETHESVHYPTVASVEKERTPHNPRASSENLRAFYSAHGAVADRGSSAPARRCCELDARKAIVPSEASRVTTKSVGALEPATSPMLQRARSFRLYQSKIE